MSFGLGLTGFTRKRLDDIKDELEASYRTAFGADILVGGDSVFGQLIGIHAEREALIWELAESTYLSQYPDTASGVPLDNAVALTGHSRLPATRSTVTATLATLGASPVTVPAGSRARVTATGATFELIADAIIPPSGSVDAAFRGVTTGPLEAPIATLTTIVDPTSGWDSVTNAAAAIVGRNIETDAALRARRLLNLSTAQGGTIAAMRARLPELVPAITYVAVTENRTDTTNLDGLPPHSVRVIAIGGTDAAVAQAIWDTKPAGANTSGSSSAVIVDSEGNNQTIYFERGTDVPIYLIANLGTNAGYPGDGDAIVTALLAAFDDQLTNGEDVLNWRLVAALDGVSGIETVQIFQGIAPSPSSTANTPIAANEKATISAANIIVNS